MNIRIYANDKKYVISWALNEDFTEIKGKIFEPFMLTAEFWRTIGMTTSQLSQRFCYQQ